MIAASGLTETKKHIFISHSSHDNRIGQKLCDWLEGRGVPCWFSSRPADLDPGSEFDDSIVAALNESAAVVLLFSAASNGSRWVKREMAMANTRSLPVLPIRLDQSSPTGGMEAYLTTVQWTDLDHSNWEGSLERVVAQLMLHKSGAPAQRAAKATPAPNVLPGYRLKALHQMLIALTVGASLIAAAYLAFREKALPVAPSPTPSPPPIATQAPTPTPKPPPQPVTTELRICYGEIKGNCGFPHDVWLGCGTDVEAWARTWCPRGATVAGLGARAGNKCGYAQYSIKCTKDAPN